MAGNPRAKGKARAEDEPPRKTPDEIRQMYLKNVKKSQAAIITEKQSDLAKFLVNPNRKERYFCHIKGCVYGSNNRPSEVTVHKGGNPHPEAKFDVSKVITVPTADFLRDKDLKASEEATTEQDFYDIFNHNLAAEFTAELMSMDSYTTPASESWITGALVYMIDAVQEATRILGEPDLLGWPEVREDWRDGNDFFES